MNREKILLTDIDGVLLDWPTSFELWYAEQQGIPHADLLAQKGGSCANHVARKKLHEWVGRNSFEECKNIEVREFNKSPYYSNLVAYNDAKEILPLLNKEGWMLIAISASSDPKKTISIKKQNLDRNFGSIFSDLRCEVVKEGAGKGKILKEYQPTFWIEDNLNNAKEGLPHGHRPILILREKTERKIERRKESEGEILVVNNWKSIYQIIQRGFPQSGDGFGIEMGSSTQKRCL